MNLETIINAIKHDPENQAFTEQGIEPILQVHERARVLIIGQAPGRQTQDRQKAFDDRSGQTLRRWMGVNETLFYSREIAIVPMDFYYPGKGKNGDLPPRRYIAQKWHAALLEQMPSIRLTILVGNYAVKYYLKESRKQNLTETVRHFALYLPDYFPIVHPSPLNFRWQRKNPWFEQDVVPVLQREVCSALGKDFKFFQLK